MLRLFDKFWIYIAITIAIISGMLNDVSIFNLSVVVSGVLCVILAAKGNILTYPIGIYATITYAFTAYKNGLNGEVLLNILFFLPTSIIGWAMWKKKMKDSKTVIMRRLDNKKRSFLFLGCILLTLICGFLLSKIPGQNTAYIDGLTNVLSVCATILMMYRFQEQWFFYITLNIFTIIMWSIRMFNGSNEGSAMVIMWTIYLINSIYGYIKWNIGAKKNELAGIK